MSTEHVAAKYRVSASWVRRLKQRRRETGSTEPKEQRHGPAPSRVEHAEKIAAAGRERPADTLDGHRARLGLGLRISSLWRAMKALGLTVKKKSRGPPSRTGPTSRPPANNSWPTCRRCQRSAWCSS